MLLVATSSSARGPISWAVAVDDLDEARAALEAAGFAPDPPVEARPAGPSTALVLGVGLFAAFSALFALVVGVLVVCRLVTQEASGWNAVLRDKDIPLGH